MIESGSSEKNYEWLYRRSGRRRSANSFAALFQRRSGRLRCAPRRTDPDERNPYSGDGIRTTKAQMTAATTGWRGSAPTPGSIFVLSFQNSMRCEAYNPFIGVDAPSVLVASVSQKTVSPARNTQSAQDCPLRPYSAGSLNLVAQALPLVFSQKIKWRTTDRHTTVSSTGGSQDHGSRLRSSPFFADPTGSLVTYAV